MKALSEENVDKMLQKMKGWVNEIDAISKNFSFDSFKDAMTFAQKVGDLAEEAQHHPDIIIHGYSNVQIILRTHDANGVTEKDFDVASKVDSL